MKNIGVYIHIPFCRRKCLYCDFCSYPGQSGETVTAYLIALCRQLEALRGQLDGFVADTVYFGGGTPTLLTPEQLGAVLGTLRRTVSVAHDAEITVECNPATTDRAALRQLRDLGINRLSIGAQSMNDDELGRLGRLHTAADTVSTVNDARDAGFGNISADLMYGIPGQTRDSFAATLDGLLALKPGHISAYCLKVEEGTPFGRMGDSLKLPDDETCYAMYRDCIGMLAGAGLEQYEISNFALAGLESRHNLKYWQGGEYLGLGVAAHSYFGGRRFAAPRDMKRYLSGMTTDPDSVTVIDDKAAETEFVMLSMRLAQGLDAGEYRRRFGFDPSEKYAGRFQPYIDSGHVVYDGGWRFTAEGMFVSNYILSSVLDL